MKTCFAGNIPLIPGFFNLMMAVPILILGTDGAAAFYAGSEHIDGSGTSVDAHFLSLKVRPEHSFGGFVGMAVGMPGDGSFSAYRTFICHDN